LRAYAWLSQDASRRLTQSPILYEKERVKMQDRTRSSFELLLEISRELAASLDLRSVLARVLYLSTSNVGAERGSLIVLDQAGQPVEAAIAVNDHVFHPTPGEMQAIIDRGLAGWVAQNRQPVLIADTRSDPRWTQRPDDASERSGSKSAICVPLLASGQLTGVLTLVHARPHFFTEEHLQLLQAIADLAGIAVRNAHLYASVEQAQRRYRELFEDSVDPILLTDFEGRILEANRQAVRATLSSLSRLTELNISQLHDLRGDLLGENFSRLGENATVRYESMLHREGLPDLPVEVHVRRVDYGGQPTLQWILRDISERKQLDRMRDDLMAMIYHDLRSPLANIISSLDILDTLLPADQAESVRPIFQITTRSADRLQRLISSLLDINRLEAGQPIANRREVDPRALVEESLDAVRVLAESKGQTLHINLPASLPPIHADGDMLRRVLINLLENAVKFTPLSGSIEVGCQADAEMVQFWVKDSGQGIPEDALELIFDKFTRLQADRYPKGLGLGLAFCRLAVQAHGGKIWAESRPGEGSRFVFTIPITAPA
jgi:PAS domain S-box-containing protein